MFIFENIKKVNDIVTCDFMSDHVKEYGRISYNLATKVIESVEWPKGREFCSRYVNHITNYFDNIKDFSRLPNPCYTMWY